MRAPLVARHKPGGAKTDHQRCYMFLNRKRSIVIHAPYTHTVAFDVSVTYPQGFHRLKFVIIPRVLYSSNIYEILLYDWQSVVLMRQQGWGQVLFEVLESSTSIFHICKYKFKYSEYLEDSKYTKYFFNQVQVKYKYFGNKQ